MSSFEDTNQNLELSDRFSLCHGKYNSAIMGKMWNVFRPVFHMGICFILGFILFLYLYMVFGYKGILQDYRRH